MFEPGPESLEMARLPDSGIWCRSVRLPSDLRGSYGFYPGRESPPTSPPEEWEHIFHTQVRDPLNPQTIRFPKIATDPNDQEMTRSVLELPRAIPQPFVRPRPGVPRGRLESRSFPSRILGGDHPIRVYQSPGCPPEGPSADLLILFDGLAYEHAIPTPTILDNLRTENRIDPLVAVLWDYPLGALRNIELECNPRLAECLETEFLPWVRARYQLTRDPSRNVVGGSSAGGLGASYVAWKLPGVFGKVLSQSGWYACAPSGVRGGPGWLPDQYRAGPKRPIEFYLDAGTLESAAGAWAEGILPSNRSFRDILQAQKYTVHYAEFTGGHDHANWRGTLSDGLEALLPRKASG
ncbi:MAG: DUF3327 domain-containing protein [Thermoplasmata archaeon]|nr:DUF3327 domain-containing protein [Thermoplasmata archaeon]